MPHLKDHDRRATLSAGLPALEDGAELNFVITTLVDQFIERHGLNYHTLEEIDGALDLCKAEFVGVVVRPYEDLKIEENGNAYAYTAALLTTLRLLRDDDATRRLDPAPTFQQPPHQPHGLYHEVVDGL